MSDPSDPAKSATAVLIACLVKAMSESEPSFQDRFVANLDRAYRKRKDDGATISELESLSWTRELITGFSQAKGGGAPFLK